MPLPPDLQLLAEGLFEQHGREGFQLALSLGGLAAQGRQLSRRALTRAMEDVEDGVPTTILIAADPRRSNRGERISVKALHGDEPAVLMLSVTGMRTS
jgi:hypothetical protein